MTMIRSESLGVTPSPPRSRCSLCLGFPGGPSTNTFTRYFSSYETVWIKLTNVCLSFGHKKYWVKYPPVTKNYSIVETACDHGWLVEWVRLLCQPQTIIIPNYCSNYFNIITAPLPTVGLATYSTGKYILIFSTFFLKIPFGCRIWFFVFVRWGFLCFGKGEDYLHFWNFRQNF